MKYPLLFLFIFLLTSSCQFFETEKISSDTFYEEEMKSIDWNDIDQYPTFSECKEYTEKAEQRTCFVGTISNQIYQSIQDQDLTVMNHFNDTIEIDFSISNSGKLQIKRMRMDSLVENRLPGLKVLLSESIDKLAIDAPAYKRGIPVNTSFTLPIVLRTE